MVRLRTFLTLVCVLAAVVGSTTVVPNLGTPECIDTDLNSTNPLVPKEASLRMCGAKEATVVIDLCRDRGGINAELSDELQRLATGRGGLTKCAYLPEYMRGSLTCICCVYGPCNVTELYDFCRCATVQPPTDSPFGIVTF